MKGLVETFTFNLQNGTDLGHGWAPVVINSELKYKFIRENQRHLSSNRSFYIGGTTNTGTGEELEYFEYRPYSIGETSFF